MSREKTVKEIKEEFLQLIKVYVGEWNKTDKTKEECLRGLAFGILVILDGESVGFPGCKVIPEPHPDDKEYRIKNGENYFPDNVDIAGNLHHEFYNGVKAEIVYEIKKDDL